MYLNELCDSVYKDQMIALRLNGEIVWTGKANAVAMSDYRDFEVESIDLAVTTFQPKHCGPEHSWNNLLIDIKEPTYKINASGFRRLCYAVYLEDWKLSHKDEEYLSMLPADYEEFLENEYSDPEQMNLILSDGMWDLYEKFKEVDL